MMNRTPFITGVVREALSQCTSGLDVRLAVASIVFTGLPSSVENCATTASSSTTVAGENGAISASAGSAASAFSHSTRRASRLRIRPCSKVFAQAGDLAMVATIERRQGGERGRGGVRHGGSFRENCYFNARPLPHREQKTMSETTPYRVQVTAVAEYVSPTSRARRTSTSCSPTTSPSSTPAVRAQSPARHWVITDGNGRCRVHSQGVVGERPVLGPGQAFRYTSGCVLATPVGTIQGSYRMRADDGHEFEAEIPAFMLAVPKLH